MTTVTHILDQEALRRLVRLRGQTWRCFGGPDVSDWLTDVSIFIVTEQGAVTLTGETDDLAFEGEGDTYATLRVDDGASNFPIAAKEGNLYYFHAGQEILDVLVLRESVTEIRDGHPAWTYLTDLGIVFVFADGVIAVTKVSHHTELLAVLRADSIDTLYVKEPSNVWVDKLDIEYTFDRELIALPPAATAP